MAQSFPRRSLLAELHAAPWTPRRRLLATAPPLRKNLSLPPPPLGVGATSPCWLSDAPKVATARCARCSLRSLRPELTAARRARCRPLCLPVPQVAVTPQVDLAETCSWETTQAASAAVPSPGATGKAFASNRCRTCCSTLTDRPTDRNSRYVV